MSTGPNLWWVYNAEDQSFSTLPTGPFLVPALLIMGVLSLFGVGRRRVVTVEELAGPLAKDPSWQQKRKRYQELIDKSVATGHDLEVHEIFELHRLGKYLHNPYNR